jgi:large subunit ribosomal protein L4
MVLKKKKLKIAAAKVKKPVLRASKKVTRIAKKPLLKAAAVKDSKKETIVKDGKLSVYDLSGKVVDQLSLDPMFTQDTINSDVIYQAVVMYQAGQREGTASTKERGAVSGGGKKPWRQKGTGRARHGSIRSPIWRHGGTTFGPAPRDFSYRIPQQIRKKAVVETIKDKVHSGKLVVVQKLDVVSPKTRNAVRILQVFKLEKPLFLVEDKSRNLALSCRNLQNVDIKKAMEVNAMDIVSHKECVMTTAAYQRLVERLKT